MDGALKQLIYRPRTASDGSHQDANMREARPPEAAKHSTEIFQIKKVTVRDL